MAEAGRREFDLPRRVYKRDWRGLLEQLAAGADPGMTDKEGGSALQRACDRDRFGPGELEMIKALLAAGADPNESWAGETALWRLTRGGGLRRVEAARALIAAGARIEGARLALAARAAWGGRREMALLLLEAGKGEEWASAAASARAGGFEELGGELESAWAARQIAESLGEAKGKESAGPARRL